MTRRVTVHVPATSANLGPGFDVLGVALRFFNEVTFETDGLTTQRTSFSLAIHVEGEGHGTLPRNESNLVARAAMKVFDRAKRWPKSLRVRLLNRIPTSRGLGSSAAATVGGMCAANALVGRPLKDAELLDMGVAMEGHPDNIVPALCGGLCISGMVDDRPRYLCLRAPGTLEAVVCVPDRPLATAEARRALPSRLPLAGAVFTSSRVAFLVGAFAKRRFDLLDFAMDDVLHQPARARLIPGLRDVIQEAKTAGAYGSALSGAGSSVIAFVRPGTTGRRVGAAMERAFQNHHLKSRALHLKLDNRGTRYS